jgi:hypothetical protein
METTFKDDKTLLQKFAHAKRKGDHYFDSFDNPELKQFVLDYLNSRLPIIYSPENEPENFWNRKKPMTAEGLFDGGGVEIKEAEDGEICTIFYFDCDAYRFEGWVYVTDDHRIFFTDWEESSARTEEIANYLK